MSTNKKNGHWTDRFSFIMGTVRYHDLGYLILQDDNIDANSLPHSQFIEWDRGLWGNGDQEHWTAVSMSVCEIPKEQMIAISPQGNVKLIGSKDIHCEKIESQYDFRCIKGIGEKKKAYACGMQRQVYRRDNKDKWVSIADDIIPKEEVKGFEAIDGFGENDIYACGWEGEIWYYNGKNWQQLETLTKHILTVICCAENRKVYACGRQGTIIEIENKTAKLIHGDDKNFKQIVVGGISSDIFSTVWFNEKLYVSTMQGVYTLETDNQLKSIDFGEDIPKTFYNLCTADGVLWSIGAKDVMAFDGKKWERID